jgi:molybdate transport system substrate-binding protein
VRRALAAASLAAVTAGCSPQPSPDTTVFAASSLKPAFEELGALLEQHDGTAKVAFNFAGSADLVAQIQQGARADVLATADETTMAAAGLPPATIFATNTMTIAVPADNPGEVQTLSDLADPGLLVVVCAPQVPCGAATERVEDASGVVIATDSEEGSVADVLGKVRSGQADAGVVYTSDVVTAGAGVRAIDIPPAVNTVNRYPIATVGDDPLAREFVDLVLSERGRAVMRDAGFGLP